MASSLLTFCPADAERAVAVALLGYPEDSIGRLMTPDYVKVRPDWDGERVLEHIRQYGQDSETLSTIYVVDEQDILLDDVRISWHACGLRARAEFATKIYPHVRKLMDEERTSVDEVVSIKTSPRCRLIVLKSVK